MKRARQITRRHIRQDSEGVRDRKKWAVIGDVLDR